MPSAVAKPSTDPIVALVFDPQGHFLPLLTALREQSGWHLTHVTDGLEFSQYLSGQPLDVALIATSDAQACNHCFVSISTQQPQAVRVMLHAGPNPPANLKHLTELAHYCTNSNEAVRAFTDKSLQLIKLNRLVHKSKTRDYVNSLGKLPSPPKIYQELSLALSSDQSNAKEIAKIISKDPAMAVKVLKVVNSAYFGLGRQISNIQEAVTLLGLRMLRALSISGQLLNQYPQHRNWSYFSFEAMNKRTVLVARLAQQICQDVKTDTATADQAFIGGLLHDLGMLIFASQDSGSYRKIMVKSAQTQTHICIIEKQMLGVFHGEIAAYLLTQWKLPPSVAEAVLLHHTPQLSANPQMSPLAAVHIADSLIPEVETEIGAIIGNNLNQAYVKQLKLEQWVLIWKQQAEKMFAEASF